MSFTAPVNDCTMPAASVATRVTSARPIMSAAAVEAVRCGLRRLFSPPSWVLSRSGRKRGNCTGHSGCQPKAAFRIHMIATISAIGLKIVATKKISARMRQMPQPGVKAA